MPITPRKAPKRSLWLAASALVVPIQCLSAAPASATSFEQVSTFAGSGEEVQLGGVSGMAVNSTGAGGVPAGTLYAMTQSGSTKKVVPFVPAPEGGLKFNQAWEVRLVEGSCQRCGPGSEGGGSCSTQPRAIPQRMALRATLRMNGIGEAGVRRAEVILPSSEFIANAHFKTICTRVLFKQGLHPGEMCPKGSIYGYAKAVTPILSTPLEGPLFLRSSEHQLPDVVASLHNGEIDVVLDGRVDSVKGRLRNTFESTPDAPVSSVQIALEGGKKGLFENSTDLCAATQKAKASFTGQNGKAVELRPVVKALGCKDKAAKRHKPRG